MNSLPVLEAVAPAPAEPLLPCLAGGENVDEPIQSFGEVLEEVSSEAESESDTENAAPFQLSECETIEEERTGEAIPEDILALLCFCPPPVVEAAPVKELHATAAAVAIESEPLPAAAPEVPETEAPQKKSEQSEGKIPLDPRIFQPVSETLPEADAPPQQQKVPPTEVVLPQLPIVATRAPRPDPQIPAGTPAAKQAPAMNNGQKTAENAPTIEQKMPVREAARRVVPEVARVENSSIFADSHSQRISIDQIDSPIEVIPVQTVETVNIVETIRNGVTQLRMRGENSVTVVLKPDTGTELQIQISIQRDGAIQAHARCERGDFQNLSAQWTQLQQTLAVHGVRLTDLSNTGNQSFSQQHNDSSAFQNFDRGHNSQQRGAQHHRAVDEELAASAPRLAPQKTFHQPAAAPTTSRRWQSWA